MIRGRFEVVDERSLCDITALATDLGQDAADDIRRGGRCHGLSRSPTLARAPPGAPSPVKLRQTYSRDAFRIRTKSKYRKHYKNV